MGRACFWVVRGLGGSLFDGVEVAWVVFEASGWAAPLAMCLRRREAAFWEAVVLDAVEVLVADGVRCMVVGWVVVLS